MQATAYEASQGLVVRAGSQAVAEAVVLGRSANGRVEWRAADGRTLKEIQEAEAGYGERSCGGEVGLLRF